jgi:sugar lactone lactonase YvrE
MGQIELIEQAHDTCGESPIWDPLEKALYWCDTQRPLVHRYDRATGRCQSFGVDRNVLALGRAGVGRWLLVTPEALVLWKTGSPTTTMLAAPEKGRPDIAFNDGTVDPAGRYVAGTYNTKIYDAPDGNLWSVDASGKVMKLDSGLVLPNGMTFSPEGRTLYVAEMFRNRILAYDYDPATGAAGSRHVFVEVPKEDGMPDGLVTDTDGYLWSAHWQGWRITRYSPSGKIDTVIEVPFTTPTCAGFGGEAMNELYVASATQGLSEQQLAQSENPGGLFRIAVNHTGLLEREFGC